MKRYTVVSVIEKENAVRGNMTLVFTTLETSRDLKDTDPVKSKRARDVAYRFLINRGIQPKDTVEETMRYLTLQ